jgi:hypothetical protein
MPTDEEMIEATAYLAQFPEYRWLTTGGLQMYRISDITPHLAVGEKAIAALCERGEIAGAVSFGTPIGWRIPRSGLIVWLAAQVRRNQAAG